MDKNEKLFTIKILIRINSRWEVAYFNKILPFQAVKYGWYFEYLCALLKVKYPRGVIEVENLFWCTHVNKNEYIAKSLPNKLKGCKAQLTKLQNVKAKTAPDLFGFSTLKIDEKIEAREKEMQNLQKGIYNYYIPEDYVNNIKKLLQ